MDQGIVDRFWSKVEKTDTCWLWTASVSGNGYGQFFVRRDSERRRIHIGAHRFAYEIARGAVPEGLVLDHLCRNRMCVNPDHLEPVTNRENLRRGAGFVGQQARQTHCSRAGHPLSGSNLRINNRGERICRACESATNLRRRASTTAAHRGR